MVIDIIGLLQLVALGSEAVEQLSDLLTAVLGEPEPDYSDLSYEEKKELLKQCTRIVFRLQLDVNCYPLGYETTVLYGMDGEPLP